MSEEPCNEPLTGSPAESFTSFCDERLRTLPKLERVELVGVSTEGGTACLYRFDSKKPGIVLADGKGGFVFTDTPILDLPQLVNYLNGQGQFVLDGDGNQIEQEPPAADYLMVQMADGRHLKLRGEPGKAAFAYWDGTQLILRDFDEVPLETADYPKEAELMLVGIDPLDLECGALEAPVRQIKEWTPGEGVIFFKPDPVTGQVKPFAVDLCTVWEQDMTQSSVFPFIPACVGGKSVKFIGGTTGGMVYWHAANQEWARMDIDPDACNPECSCADYLTVVYDCAAGTFEVKAPPTHVLMAKDADTAGVNARITVDLPWPALVVIHAARRLTPTQDSLDVVAADIIVNNCTVTSPDDGGLVAALVEASTSVGCAMLYLPAGQHSIYTSNEQKTTVDAGANAIQWTGSWIKMHAHKIAECDPPNGLVVPGDIRRAYGGTGGTCDCPEGPKGPSGPEGPRGPPGTGGSLDWDPPEGTEPVYGGWCYTTADGYTPEPYPEFDAAQPTNTDGNQYWAWCVDNLGAGSWVNISTSVYDATTSP